MGPSNSEPSMGQLLNTYSMLQPDRRALVIHACWHMHHFGHLGWCIFTFACCSCWSAERLSSAPYYTEAVAALRRHALACDALGPPLRFKALNLGSKENCVTEERAHVREGGWLGQLSVPIHMLAIRVL